MEADKLKILYVTSEAVPFVKSGGLADVSGSLPQVIKELGHDIRVVLPEYKQISAEYKTELEHITDFETHVAWRRKYVGINKLQYQQVPFYFIDNKYYFDREFLYENLDKCEQFAFFARGVLEMLPEIDFKPDIIHCNDWQTAMINLFLYDNYRGYDFYKKIKTIYTIHNLGYQGQFERDVLEDILGVDSWHWIAGKIRHDNLINFMKTGIMYSDLITTVSETYAHEIKKPAYGEGLDYALRMRENDLYGIVNGIDYDEYNPATDKNIYQNYDPDSIHNKYENKLKLQKEMELPEAKEKPVLGFISRLVEQKGVPIILEILEELLEEDIQFIMLGTGNPEYEWAFRELAADYPDKMKANIKYDDALARKIYAGIDIFLMPSLYEPCGLSQLISMSYGTVPIVRETGGLNDTVHSYNENTGRGNGFSFSYYNAQDFLYTVKRALQFYENKEVWPTLVKRVMQEEFSWERSAHKYVEIYNKYL